MKRYKEYGLLNAQEFADKFLKNRGEGRNERPPMRRTKWSHRKYQMEDLEKHLMCEKCWCGILGICIAN